MFIDLLNTVWVGNIDNDAEKLLKIRSIHESDGNYPKDVLHIYTGKEPAIKKNEAVLNELPGELYTVKANDKIPYNCKHSLT